MIKVAIVDDELSVREQLVDYMKKYADSVKAVCEIKCYDGAPAFLNRFGKDACDLLLLDIEMPDVDGMALAAQVRRTDTSVSIVFVTNMAQYAIRGYEVDASDFIVKPVSYGDFSLKVGRIFRRLLNRGETQLTVNDGDMVKRIAVADIRYAEVSGHTLTFHMRDCVVAGRGALKKYENALLAAGFARCSNYCIVNLRCVTGMSGHTVFVSGADGSREPEGLAISHPRKKDFVRILNEFWRDNI